MKSIIFDLDGTLWDSTDTIIKAWEKTFKIKDLKITITNEELKNLLGKPSNEISEFFFKNLKNINQVELMTACEKQEIIMLNKFGGILYQNLEKTIKKLYKNYKLYIVSNCQQGYIEVFLNYHNLTNYFSDLECEGNTSLPKEKNIISIIKRNNIKQAIYVGDTIGDLIASNKANIPFIYAKYGFGKIDYCNHKILSIEELPNTLKEMNF